MNPHNVKISGKYSCFKSLIHIILSYADHLTTDSNIDYEELNPLLNLTYRFQKIIILRLPNKIYHATINITEAEVLKTAILYFSKSKTNNNSDHTYFLPNFSTQLIENITKAKIATRTDLLILTNNL